jgi:hypothetical protein
MKSNKYLILILNLISDELLNLDDLKNNYEL